MIFRCGIWMIFPDAVLEGYHMVVQVLANLLPAMTPDYAQAPAAYVETDGSMC